MTDKQSQTSSSSQASTSSSDVEMKPDHGIDTNSDATDLLESPVKPNPSNVASQTQTSRNVGSISVAPSVCGEKIVITVAPFTGGPFSVSVNKRDSVEDLKKVVAKKLKVLKERICLLYRER